MLQRSYADGAAFKGNTPKKKTSKTFPFHVNYKRHAVSCFSGSPKGIEFNAVKDVLLSVKAVKSVHSLHLWALTLGQSLVSVHLATGNKKDRTNI